MKKLEVKTKPPDEWNTEAALLAIIMSLAGCCFVQQLREQLSPPDAPSAFTRIAS
jgi:hypothetical protein